MRGYKANGNGTFNISFLWVSYVLNVQVVKTSLLNVQL